MIDVVVVVVGSERLGVETGIEGSLKVALQLTNSRRGQHAHLFVVGVIQHAVVARQVNVQALDTRLANVDIHCKEAPRSLGSRHVAAQLVLLELIMLPTHKNMA